MYLVIHFRMFIIPYLHKELFLSTQVQSYLSKFSPSGVLDIKSESKDIISTLSLCNSIDWCYKYEASVIISYFLVKFDISKIILLTLCNLTYVV